MNSGILDCLQNTECIPIWAHCSTIRVQRYLFWNCVCLDRNRNGEFLIRLANEINQKLFFESSSLNKQKILLFFVFQVRPQSKEQLFNIQTERIFVIMEQFSKTND